MRPTACPATRKGESASLLSLQISGVNLDELPGVDLKSLTYGQVTPAAGAPLPNVVLDSVHPNLGVASVGGIKLSTITNLSAVVDCTAPFDCNDPNATLASADLANKLNPESVLADIGAAANGLPLHELTLGLVGSAGDDPYDKSPDELGITPQSAGSGGTIFGVSYARIGMGPGSTLNPTVVAKLPDGFVYKGGSSTLDGNPVPDPIVNGTILTFDLGTNIGSTEAMYLYFRVFAVNPTEYDGDNFEATQLQATISDGTFAQAVGSDAVRVSDGLETGDTIYDAVPINRDTLVFGRIEPRPDGDPDVDYYEIRDVEPGSTVTVYLNQLNYDADLAVFHSDNTTGPGRPLREVPIGQRLSLFGDSHPKFYNGGEPLVSEGEPDVPLPEGFPVAGLSSNRGNKAERVEVIAWPSPLDGEGNYGSDFIQVSGFNGASGNGRYAVRYTIDPPKSVPVVPRTGYTHPGAAPAVPSLPTTPIDTLILTNPGRLGELYSSDSPGVAAVGNSVNSLAAQTNGVVFPVNSSSRVRDAYTAADANPGDPDVHNDVVREINTAVDAFLGPRRSGLKNIIIVGTDEVIPFARLMDLTQTANERSFAQSLVGSAPGNALIGSALAGRILSDDPFGSFSPVSFGGTHLYGPDVALGRLVESPGQINATIAEYLDVNAGLPGDPIGTLRPDKTLSAGYDFMTLVSNDITSAFQQQLPGAAHASLVNNSWDKNDAPRRTERRRRRPDFGERALLADIPLAREPRRWRFVGRDSGSADPICVADCSSLWAAILATASRTSWPGPPTRPTSPKRSPVNPLVLSWATPAFGLGLKNVNAFSQKLFGEFGRLLSSTSLGGALQQAKQLYLADGVTNPYDYKVIAQTVFYGIPQYTIAGATPVAPPPAAEPGAIDPRTGLLTAPITFNQPTSGPDWVRHDTVDPDDGDFWTLPGNELAVVQDRPLQPKVHRDATLPGQVLGGALVTGVTVGADEAGFDPVLARPLIADNGGEAAPELQFGDVVFPTKLADVTTFIGANGEQRQRVVTVPAKFTATGLNDNGKLVGIETRYSRITVEALYVPAGETDTSPATVTDVTALQPDGSGFTIFKATVNDDESAVKRVLVLYRGEGETEFHAVDLTLTDADLGVWSATVALTGDVEFFTQAVNNSARVTTKTNKGLLFNEQAVEHDTSVSVSFNKESQDPDGTYFVGPVRAFLNTQTPAVIHYTVDSGAGPGSELLYTPSGILFGPGEYVVNYRTDQGEEGSFYVFVEPDGVTESVTVTMSRAPDIAPDIYTAPVTAHVASDDPDAGPITISLDGDAGVTYPNNDVVVSTDGIHELVYSTDRGTTNVDDPFVIKLDSGPPVVEIHTPVDGSHLILRASESVDFACIDPFLLTCVGTQAQGSPVDTNTVTDGVTPRTFSVQGTDQFGRVGNATSAYHVSYQPESFPCDDGPGHQTIGKVPSNKPKKVIGEFIHVIFRVCDANGASVASPELSPALGVPREILANGNLGSNALGGCNSFLDLLPVCVTQKRATKFSPLGDRWGFNHDTSQLSNGLHRFRVFLRDGTSFDYVLNRQTI